MRATSESDRAEEIVNELSVHAAIEEQVLYPAARQSLPEGEPLVERSLQEHQEVKELLASVDGRPVDDPDVRTRFERLRAAVEEHVAEEEGHILPALRTSCGEERLMQMGRAMQAARAVAPTRPHPKAPSTPPATSSPAWPPASSTRCATRPGT